MLCTLSRFNFPCSLDNQAPHGHPLATTVPQGLYRVVDVTDHITVDIGVFIMLQWVFLTVQQEAWKTFKPINDPFKSQFICSEYKSKWTQDKSSDVVCSDICFCLLFKEETHLAHCTKTLIIYSMLTYIQITHVYLQVSI